jgi:hypothetical protein
MGLHSEESGHDDQAQSNYQCNCMKNVLNLTKLKTKNQSPPKKRNTHFCYLLERWQTPKQINAKVRDDVNQGSKAKHKGGKLSAPNSTFLVYL